MWTIRDKYGSPRAVAEAVEYNGKWLDECYVTVTIESPEPIDFQIGDWLEYRGERFEINYDPGKIKSAPRYVKKDAFKYENIKFNSLADELVRCDFLDIVLNDNDVHFTGLPKFSFFASTIKDLADRIQANLDRCYPGMWTVEVYPEFADKTDVNVAVDKWKVWDALKSGVEDFGAYFTIYGRHLIIGTAGVPADHLFRYGKGEGLYELEQNADSDQLVCTRVRAYGSTRNLPHRYYHNLPDIDRAEAPIHSVVSKDYINGGGAACAMSFRFLEQFVDLNKCVEDNEKYWFAVTINGICYAAYWDASQNCYTIGHKPSKTVPGVNNTILRAAEMEKIGTGTTVSFEAYREGAPGIVRSLAVPNNMAVNFLMLPGFPDKTQDPYIDSPNIDALGIREHTIFFDGSDTELDEIYPSIEGMTAEELLESGLPCNSEGELDILTGADRIEDDGVGNITGDKSELEEKDSYFKVRVKDLGFNINDCLIEGNSESPAMSFKSGKLGGREFEIFSCEPIVEGGITVGYELELQRVYDNDIKLWFPYNDYNAEAGDRFVLLNIGMPDVYVKAASERLLKAAMEWLSKHDYSRSIYSPKIDEIFMARQHDEAMKSNGQIKSLHDNLKEGMLLLFEDEDFGIDASVFIEQLTIKEGSTPIPTYEVTLKEEPTVGTLQKMQNQIDSLARGNGQGGGGYNAAQIRELISAYGGTLFLSKVKADRTPYDLAVGGEIIAEGDTRSKDFAEGLTGFGWKGDNTGHFEMDSLSLRKFLEVPELRYNRTEVYSGITWHCPGGGIVESVQNDGDGIGLITLKLEDGEIGMVAEGDICMAFWHFPDGNATKDSDDGTGNFTFAGYTSVYFTIEEVEGSHNERIYIQCREKDGGEYFDMPQPGMHFVCYGNRTNKDRQKSRYATRSYERYLADVTDYTFGTENIMMQLGDLSNLTINGMSMSGYSAYLNNVYFDGVIRQLQEMKLVEWQCIPNIIHCDADGAPTDTGISILAYHVQGNKRTLINAPGYSGDWEVRYKFTSDEGVTHDRLLLSTYIELDRRDRHPKFELAVIDTATGETVSEYEVGNVCDGETGKDGKDGKDGVTGPQGAVVRMRGAYEIGEMYYAGDMEVNGVRWLDIVWRDDAYNNRTYYVCRSTHRYTQTWEAVKDNFEEMSYLSALFADIIIATQGRVKFLSSNEIVFGEGADIYGRIGAPTQSGSLLDLIMWLGGATAESATTTFSKDGVARFGRNGADRIEIDPRPNFRQIRIFNSDNDKVVTIDGREHDLNEAYQANDTRLTKSFANQSFMADGVYSLGQLNAGDSGVRLKGSMNLSGFLTSLWHQSAPPAPGMPDTDESYGRESAVTVSVVLMDAVTREDCYSESRYIESESITSGEIRDDNNDDGIQVDNNGVAQKITDISERFDFDIAVDGGSYYVALRVKFYPAIVKRWNGTEQTAVNSVSASNYTASLLYGDKPQCFIGQNGLIAANSPQDYLRAGVLDGEFTIEGVTKGNGLRLQGGKFYAKDDAHPEWAEITFNYK